MWEPGIRDGLEARGEGRGARGKNVSLLASQRPSLSVTPLPFEEAIRFFAEKGLVLSPDSYRDVWAAAHVQAFTVARVTAMDLLEDLRKAVDDAVRNGTPLNAFKRDLVPILERRGWFAPQGKPETVMPDGTV